MVRVEHICPSVSLSANESFKLNYGRTLRWSMLAAVIALGLLWVFLPRYEPTPYTLRQDYMEWIEIEEPELDIPEETPLLPVPVVPRDIEPAPGNFEEEPWIPPDFWDPVPVAPAPADPSVYDGFVAKQQQAEADVPGQTRLPAGSPHVRPRGHRDRGRAGRVARQGRAGPHRAGRAPAAGQGGAGGGVPVPVRTRDAAEGAGPGVGFGAVSVSDALSRRC